MKSNSSSGGIGCTGVLLIVFVVLKLTGLVTWPWLWVLAPFWIPFAIATVFVVIVLLAKAAQ